ncbi:energy transducer TonB [Chitinimonas naiadis]
MQWRLVLALVVSSLLHAALLLLPGSADGERARQRGAFSVSLRNVPGVLALQADKAGVTPPPAEAATAPEPAPPEDRTSAAEVVLAPSLPPNIAAFGPNLDTRWYGANEVAIRAQPQNEIELPSPPGYQGEVPSGRVVLDVYIDEFGVTDHVDLLLVSPPGRFDESVTRPFLASRWSPAVKDGRFVKSVKQVELCIGVCGDTEFSYNGGVMTGGEGR